MWWTQVQYWLISQQITSHRPWYQCQSGYKWSSLFFSFTFRLRAQRDHSFYLQRCPVNSRRLKWTALATLTLCRWMTAEPLRCSCCYLQATAHWAEPATWSDRDGWLCQPVRTTPKLMNTRGSTTRTCASDDLWQVRGFYVNCKLHHTLWKYYTENKTK